ncbi:MAG: hypothetical protein RBS07_00655 [Lentimicrobium sp.]|nr:hypothetical protein [Lentimicrobium sp.]
MKKNLKFSFLLVFLLICTCFSSFKVRAQTGSTSADSDTLNRAHLRGLIIGGSAVYAGSMIGLYELWYKDYPQGGFHFINDNKEWLQADKTGHALSSYYTGLAGYESLRWAGVDEKKSIWFGGSIGFVYLTVIETLDGFSAGWGASGGDLLANGLGSALFIGQQLGWNEQRIKMKWSFHTTRYAKYNPELLGSNFPQRMLKDYNGQTVWLSGNIESFIQNKETNFPKWLNIAVGCGAEGMTGATSNPEDLNGVPLPHFSRYRQFYLAPDIDLTKIRTKHNTLNFALKLLGFIKFPLPTIEINKKGMKFHPIYF